MAQMVFWEKPGCINGGKQKKILTDAGNVLDCNNILEKQWTRDELMRFVSGKSASECMNFTAPAVKKGEIDPASLSLDQAIDLMIEDPILIKRPLIEVDGTYIQGFTDIRLKDYLGNWDAAEDVTTCPNLKTISCDDQSKA